MLTPEQELKLHQHMENTLSSGGVSRPSGVGEDYPDQQQRERPNVTGKSEYDGSPAHPLAANATGAVLPSPNPSAEQPQASVALDGICKLHGTDYIYSCPRCRFLMAGESVENEPNPLVASSAPSQAADRITIEAVAKEFQCDCEVCAHTAAMCPASASSLIMEVASLRAATAQVREQLRDMTFNYEGRQASEEAAVAETNALLEQRQKDLTHIRQLQSELIEEGKSLASLRAENDRMREQNEKLRAQK